MIEFACSVAVVVIGISVLMNVYRLALGPDVVDRVLALDTMVINAIGLIIVMGVWFSTTMYFEIALLFAMVGFLTTVAICKYLLRGNVLE